MGYQKYCLLSLFSFVLILSCREEIQSNRSEPQITGSEATSFKLDNAEHLHITEINYHPAKNGSYGVEETSDHNNYEFIEFWNSGSTTMQLKGLTFTNGLVFTFPEGAELENQEYGVVVRNETKFRERYGPGANILGQFSEQGLNNGGERLVVATPSGEEIINIKYSDKDPWPKLADGLGATLVLKDPLNTPRDRLDDPSYWRHSIEYHGNPGRLGDQGEDVLGIIINEVLSHTDHGDDRDFWPSNAYLDQDAIELHNPTNRALKIGGLYLSDKDHELFQSTAQITPTNLWLPPGGYYVMYLHNDDDGDLRLDFDPEDNLNYVAGSGDPPFKLSKYADDVYLVGKDRNNNPAFYDSVHFPGSRRSESFGRMNNGLMAPLESVTLGSANARPISGEVVISEIHHSARRLSAPASNFYNPPPELEEHKRLKFLQFVELWNPSNGEVDMSGWHLRGGFDYNFPEGTKLQPNETLLVVTFHPSEQNKLDAFRVNNGICREIDGALRCRPAYCKEVNGVKVCPPIQILGGPCCTAEDSDQSQLSKNGEKIVLKRRMRGKEFYWVIEDMVFYDDKSPWPDANGNGMSLNRSDPNKWGGYAGNWHARSRNPSGSYIPQQSPEPNLD